MKQKYFCILLAILPFFSQPILAADTFIDYTPITSGIGAGQTIQPSHLLNNFAPISTSINNLNLAGKDTNEFKEAIETADYVRSFDTSNITTGSGTMTIPNEALKIYVKATDSTIGGWGSQTLNIPSGLNILWAQALPVKTYIPLAVGTARPTNSYAIGFVANLSGTVTFELLGSKPWEVKRNYFQAQQTFNDVTVTGTLFAPKNDFFPTGAIFMWSYPTCPSNSLAMNGQTIGSPSSNASVTGDSIRNLYFFLWPITVLPVFDAAGNITSRGADALQDYNNNKRLATYNTQSRFIVGAGTGQGLTSRPLNSIGGQETVQHSHSFAGTTAITSGAAVANNGGGLSFSYVNNNHVHEFAGDTNSVVLPTIPPFVALTYCMRTENPNKKILIALGEK